MRNEKLEIARLLLEHGENAHVKGSLGATQLDLASEKRQVRNHVSGARKRECLRLPKQDYSWPW